MLRNVDLSRARLTRSCAVRIAGLVLALTGAAGCGNTHEGATTAIAWTTVDSLPSTSGDPTSGTTVAGSGVSESGASTSSPSTTGASWTSTGSGASSSTTLVNDVGWESDVGDPKPAGCKGKIDFLFVISGVYGV